MQDNQIILDFGLFSLEAELFDNETARKFKEHLPYVSLTEWGNELYGSVGIDLGKENPAEEIPPGGIAYTDNGNFVCIFYGQKPAWPVEYIGQITDDSWQILAEQSGVASVEIRKNESEFQE